MPKASRKGDMCSGHGCFPPSAAIAGSPDVSIDKIPALRKGDAVAPHGCGKCVPHGRTVSGGSPTVFVNGKALARIGDAINCGGSVSVGSGTTVADEQGPPGLNLRGVFGKSEATRLCMRKANRRGQAFVSAVPPK